MPIRVTSTRLSTIDLAVARPTPTGTARRGVAVVAAHQHDRRGHRHPLDQAEDEVRRVLELPEDQQIATRGDVADLLDDRQVGAEIGHPDRAYVHERQHDPGRQQACGAEERHRVDAHHLERVDLIGDPHRSKLGDDPGADLRRHHVAERIGDRLAQVAPGGEHARIAGGALRLCEVGALDAARVQARDEDKPPYDERGVDDEDARLTERLAEEAENTQAPDFSDHGAGEADDLACGRKPGTRHGEQLAHLITRRVGCVASSVCVKT